MKKVLLLIILSSMLSSCTLRFEYYLINSKNSPVQFEIYNFHVKELGVHEFQSSLNDFGTLRDKSYEKFDCSIKAKTSDNGNIISGELPAHTVMYLGFGLGPKKLFEKY